MRGGILLVFVLSGVMMSALGQTTKTVGSSGADYPTLKSAFDAINNGQISGEITLCLIANTTETVQAVLNASGSGSALYSSLLIYPTISGISVSGTLNTQMIRLNGADHVTFDGRVNLTGSRDLILVNSSTGTSAATISFIADANYNTVQHCIIRGSSPGTATGVVHFGAGTVAGNVGNTVKFCDIHKSTAGFPTNLIYSYGTTLKTNSGNILNNNLSEFYATTGYSYGITLASYNNGWVISNNSFFQPNPLPAAAMTIYPIMISGGTEHEVSGNYIGGSAPEAGGAAWSTTGSGAIRFVGMIISTNTALTMEVYNNVIRNFNWNTSSGAFTIPGVWAGIYLQGGNLKIGSLGGNIIGDTTGTGSIVVTSTAGSATPATYGIVTTTVGGGSPTIANNKIGSFVLKNTSSAANSGHKFYGIVSQYGGVNIENNLIGSIGTYGSIHSTNGISNVTGTTMSQDLIGIYANSATTNPVVIRGNTVSNMVTNWLVNNATVGLLRGILVSGAKGTVNIEDNTIRRIYSGQPMTGTGLTGHITGILCNTPLTTGVQISGNVIHTLVNTHSAASVSITGIYYPGPPVVTGKISANLVHSLNPASNGGGAVITGINLAGGVNTADNNMIRLGMDSAGISNEHPLIIQGILDGSGKNNYYFNSVYIGGSNVSNLASTYGFLSNITSGEREIRNNIFVNNRSFQVAGTTKNVACYLGAVPVAGVITGLLTDNNIYSAGATGGIAIGNGNGFYTLRQWREVNFGFLQDMHSAEGDPGFINPDGLVQNGTYPLKTSGITASESAGIAIPGIDLDIEGELRSGLTPVDIGADGGLNTSKDIFTPNFSYNLPLKVTSRDNQTLSEVIITDAGSGIPLEGDQRPRLWYKRNSGGSWISTAGVLTSGNTHNGSWSFMTDYSLQGFGSPSWGDTVFYYFVAQDQAITPNIWYSPFISASHSDVQTQVAAPSNLLYYVILKPFSGSVQVGEGQEYQSLSADAPEGLFYSLNRGILTGDVTVTIMSDLNETGEVALNPAEEEGSGSYSLMIRTDGSRRVISGSELTIPMISIRGGDRITFEGSSGFDLLFRTTWADPYAGFPAIFFDQGARDCRISGCGFESNNMAGNSAIVLIGANGENKISIVQNEMKNAGPGVAGDYYQAVLSQGSSNLIEITGNRIMNWTNRGVCLSGTANGAEITGNCFYRTTSWNAADVAAIWISEGGGHTVSDNYIGGTAPFCSGDPMTHTGLTQFRAIDINGNGTFLSSDIVNNTIRKIHLDFMVSPSSSLSLTGIRLNSGSFRVVNNLIEFNNGPYTNPVQLTGIHDQTHAPGTSVTAFNTVHIGGTDGDPEGVFSYAFSKESDASHSLRNNIFMNTRSAGGATGKHYAIRIADENSPCTLDFNNYFADGTGGFLGRAGVNDLTDLPILSGQDSHSVTVNPGFTSAEDLHPTEVSLNNKGFMVSGMNTDREGVVRSDPPDIGALEFSLYATAFTLSPPAEITPLTARLEGTIHANNELTSGFFEYGESMTYGHSMSWQPSVISGTSPSTVYAFTDHLVPNTLYHYRVKATTIKGTTYGEDRQFRTPAAAVSTFYGAGSDEWEQPANWDNGVPGSVTDVTIPADKLAVVSSPSVCHHLTVGSKGALTITGNGHLACSGDLLIGSDTEGMGSVIFSGSGLDVFGETIVQRYFTGTPESWHLLGTPVSGQSISGEFTPSGSYPDGSGYDFYLWHEPTVTWMNRKSTSWLSVNGSGDFIPGRGYLVAYQEENPIKSFRGALINEAVAMPLTNGGIGLHRNCNLAANPYPCSIDWKSPAGWQKSDLMSSPGGGYDLYIFNPLAGNYGVYNDESLGDEGTNGVGRYISATQGFFVIAREGLIENGLIVNDQARTHAYSSWLSPSLVHQVRLQVTGPEDSGKDELVAEFGHQTAGGGAGKWFSFEPKAPSLWTRKDERDLSVSFLSGPENHPSLPVFFKPGVDGYYQFKINQLPYGMTQAILEDRKTGLRTRLSLDEDFTIGAEISDETDRFNLHFTGLQTGSTSGMEGIRIYNIHDMIYVIVPVESMTGEAIAIDLQGRIICREAISGALTRFRISHQGFCIIRVISDNTVTNCNLFIH